MSSVTVGTRLLLLPVVVHFNHGRSVTGKCDTPSVTPASETLSALVDSGATNSFISGGLVEKLVLEC